MNIRVQCLVLTMLLSGGVVRSVSQEVALVCAATTSSLAGLASYQSRCPVWITVPIVGFSGYLGYAFFYQFTPAGRMERAENELNKMDSYRLAREFCFSEAQLLSIIQDAYISQHWPLISAYNDLTYYTDAALKVIDLANAAQQEDSAFAVRAQRAKQTAFAYSENMKNAVKIIRSSSGYLAQLQQFKEEQRHQEQLQVQQSMAAAQWSNAQAQHQIAAAQKELATAAHHQNAHASTKPTFYIAPGKPNKIIERSAAHHSGLSSSKSGIFSENETRDYIAQTIAALERALQAHMRFADLSNLKRAIQDSVRSAQYAYQNSSSFVLAGKRYKKDVIDQFIASAVIEYIEETSYNYAYTETQDKALAVRISDSMRNNVLAIIAQNSVINFERLTPFIGSALEKAVNDKINEWAPNLVKPKPQAPRPSATPAPTEKQFALQACCVCMDDFGEDVARIYLKPCGHDICKDCAYKWFFGATQKKECPQCRTIVDLNKLQKEII